MKDCCDCECKCSPGAYCVTVEATANITIPFTESTVISTASASACSNISYEDAWIQAYELASQNAQIIAKNEANIIEQTLYIISKTPNYLGSKGSTGPIGPTGVNGLNGGTGPIGATGPKGATGPIGATGVNGLNGLNGATGSIGATGVSGSIILDYAYIYNITAPATIAIGASIPLDTNGPITAGFSHTVSSPNITVNNAGVYEIYFIVSCVESNQFAIFVNGAISSPVLILYGSGAGTQSNVGQGILTLNSGDIISIVNNSSPAAVTLQLLAGGTQTNVNASIIIKRLA